MPPINPREAPVKIIFPKVKTPEINPPDSVFEIINSKTNTAKIAPMGSIKIPSHCKTLAILALGRKILNMGAITVGPVTTMSAAREMKFPGEFH